MTNITRWLERLRWQRFFCGLGQQTLCLVRAFRRVQRRRYWRKREPLLGIEDEYVGTEGARTPCLEASVELNGQRVEQQAEVVDRAD